MLKTDCTDFFRQRKFALARIDDEQCLRLEEVDRRMHGTGDSWLIGVFDFVTSAAAVGQQKKVDLAATMGTPEINLAGRGSIVTADLLNAMGFPGSTDRFLNSDGVKLALDVEQPARVKVRGEKLDVMKEHMNASPEVRIKYASKHAQIANYWKYFIGQQKGLKRQHVFDRKKEQEEALMAWVNSDPVHQDKYGDVAKDLSEGYAQRAKFEKSSTYMQEGAFGCEAVISGFRLYGLKMQLEKDPKATDKITAMSAQANASVRTIASRWNGGKDSLEAFGWSLGVTGEKSRYKPRNVIVQVVGEDEDDVGWAGSGGGGDGRES